MHLFFFFFTATPTTQIYTLSLHDALPISRTGSGDPRPHLVEEVADVDDLRLTGGVAQHRSTVGEQDRKSTRLNSSHVKISYAVFCLKKKTKIVVNVVVRKKTVRKHEQTCG